MLCWHPPHVPVAIGIQRATDVSFMHPASRERSTRPLTCTEQSGQQALLFIRNRVPVILVAYPDRVPSTCTPTSRLRNNVHSTEWPVGPLIHSKSRPSDSCYLPSLASQRPSPPASQRRAPATTCTQQTGRQALSFIQNRVPVIAITYTPTLYPSNYPHLNVASQSLPSHPFHMASQRPTSRFIHSTPRPSDRHHLDRGIPLTITTHTSVASQRLSTPNGRPMDHPTHSVLYPNNCQLPHITLHPVAS